MHKAILLDLGKVLVHFDFRRAYQALEPLCPHAAEEIPRRLASTGLVERFETGLIEPRDFVEQVFHRKMRSRSVSMIVRRCE